MATVLPRPNVDVVNTEDGKQHLVISRDQGVPGQLPKCRSYEIKGNTTEERVKDAVTQVINDPVTAEHLP